MNAVLIYDNSSNLGGVEVEEFGSKEEMLKFINEFDIGHMVIAAYEISKKIEIEPFEKVIKYKFK